MCPAYSRCLIMIFKEHTGRKHEGSGYKNMFVVLVYIDYLKSHSFDLPFFLIYRDASIISSES